MSELITSDELLGQPTISQLLARATREGRISYGQINDILSEIELDEDAIESLYELLDRRSIQLVDDEPVSPSKSSAATTPAAPTSAAVPASDTHADLDDLLAELDELIPTDFSDVAAHVASAEEDVEDEMAPVQDALHLYLNRMGQSPRLDRTTEQEIAQHLKAEDEEERLAAVNALVESNLRLVVHLARAAATRTTLSVTDLLQEGNLGLIDAAQRYNLKTGKNFGSFATWYIRRAMNRAINDHARVMRLSGELHAAIQKVQTAQRELSQRFQRAPTRHEISEFTGLTVSQIEEAQRAAVRPLSLDAPIGGSSEDGATEFGENIADPASELVTGTANKNELISGLTSLLEDLSDREKVIVQMRFGIGDYHDAGPRGADDVADHLGISRDRVQDLEKRALRKLRRKAKGAGLDRLFGASEDDEDDED